MTEVHWRIIANLGFKFRSHFIAHCGHGGRAARRAACGRIISRHARSLVGVAAARVWNDLPRTIVNAAPSLPTLKKKLLRHILLITQ